MSRIESCFETCLANDKTTVMQDLVWQSLVFMFHIVTQIGTNAIGITFHMVILYCLGYIRSHIQQTDWILYNETSRRGRLIHDLTLKILSSITTLGGCALFFYWGRQCHWLAVAYVTLGAWVVLFGVFVGFATALLCRCAIEKVTGYEVQPPGEIFEHKSDKTVALDDGALQYCSEENDRSSTETIRP